MSHVLLALSQTEHNGFSAAHQWVLRLKSNGPHCLQLSCGG